MDHPSSSEEIDYMSDSFVQTICGKEDIRPGLIKCHAQQYDHKAALKKMAADKKNRSCNPSLKERESTSRENGLSVPLNKDNVGFKMLQKLGFKPGSGLGKSGEGRVDPISMEVKTDRQGLGRKSSLEEIARLRAKYKSDAKEKALNIDDYRTRKAGEAAEKKAFLDLMKSQRVCWELDSKECIDEPAESWFWPECKLAVNNEHDDEDDETSTSNEEENDHKDAAEEEEEYEEDKDFSVQEKLEMLTLYLRKTYLYCVWCGYSFEDEKDLQQDCPGPTKDDH